MNYHWAVIGAGPAGIAAVGKLLDQGIQGKDILWIDPYFQAGDFGRCFKNVPSNTKVKYFFRYLNDCASFEWQRLKTDFTISQMDSEKTCHLKDMGSALEAVTSLLKAKVFSSQTTVISMELSKNVWNIHCQQGHYQAKQVIMAQGAEPLSRQDLSMPIISLYDALDPDKINNHIDSRDSIAVFGSSHSAMLVLRNLAALKVKMIVNFFRSPLRYAKDQGDWILYDNTGLKGETAAWANAHIDGQLPANLNRISIHAEGYQQALSECNKAICAIGFEPRDAIMVQGCNLKSYDPHHGIIAPGLFGLGIAYPQLGEDPYGFREYRVGLWKFMDYLNQVLPLWLK